MTIKSTSSGNGRIVFTDQSSSNPGFTDGGQIHYGHSADDMRFRTAGADRVTIDSSGRLGIGTTSPSQILHLEKSDDPMLLITRGSSNRVLLGDTGSNNGGDLLLYNSSGSNTVLIRSGANSYLNGGNVGIGTSSPSEPLHISNSDPKIRLQDSDGTNQFSTIFQNGGALNLLSRNNTNNGFITFKASDGTTTTEFARFNMSGNLGIGTTSPASSLHVHSTNFTAATFERNNASTNYGVSIDLKNSENNIFNLACEGTEDFSIGYTPSGGSKTNLFTLKSSGNVGIGISSGMTYPLTIHDNNSSNSYVHFVNSTTGTAFGDGSQIGVPSGGTDLLILNRESANIKMYTGGSEKLRIDSSGNVGIGTSSPGVQLDIESSGNNSQLELTATDGTDQSFGLFTATGNNSNGAGFYIQDKTANAIRLKVDSSGKVGIGTTSPNTNLEVTGATGVDTKIRISTAGNATEKPAIQFYRNNGAYGEVRYDAGGSVSGESGLIYTDYRDDTSSKHIWKTRNAEKMRLDSVGNVGIGTTSPFSKVQIRANTFNGTHGSYASDRVNLSSNGALKSIMYASTYNSATYPDYGMLFVHGPDTSNYNVWSISPDGPAKGDSLNFIYGDTTSNIHTLTPKVVFDGSGNVGIGTTSPANKLDVAGTINTNNAYKLDNQTLIEQTGSNIYFGDRDDNDNVVDISGFSEQAKIVLNDGFMTLSTGGSERARIDSSGNFLVGKTSPATANTGVECRADGLLVATRDNAVVSVINRKSSDGAAMQFRKDNTTVGSVSVTGSATAYNTSSDARLKDITGSARGLEVINELNPVAYDWKADGKSDEGLIAQEVMKLVPNAVSETEEGYYQMDYSKLVTPLIKAIQEQQEQIEELKQEIKELKK